jgi:hypothetical protein
MKLACLAIYKRAMYCRAMQSLLSSASRPAPATFFKGAVGVAILAVFVNLITAAVASLLVKDQLVVPAGPGSNEATALSYVAITISTLVGVLLGVISLLVLRRVLSTNAERIFAPLAIFFALVTILTSATSGIPVASKLTLAVLHLTSAAAIVTGLLAIRDKH